MDGATPIVRDWQKTAANAAGAAAVLGVTYWLLWRPEGGGAEYGFFLWPISIVVFAVAAFFTHRAVARSGFAACPGCGKLVTELSTGRNRGVACRFCGKYVEGDGGRLVLTAADQVASSAIFETTLPREVRWPDGCCVCGAPAIRNLRIELTERGDAPLLADLGVRAATLGTMKLVSDTTHSVRVPHCGQHTDGARLHFSDGAGETGLSIAFRAHAYFVAFCEQNGTVPRT